MSISQYSTHYRQFRSQEEVVQELLKPRKHMGYYFTHRYNRNTKELETTGKVVRSLILGININDTPFPRYMVFRLDNASTVNINMEYILQLITNPFLETVDILADHTEGEAPLWKIQAPDIPGRFRRAQSRKTWGNLLFEYYDNHNWDIVLPAEFHQVMFDDREQHFRIIRRVVNDPVKAQSLIGVLEKAYDAAEKKRSMFPKVVIDGLNMFGALAQELDVGDEEEKTGIVETLNLDNMEDVLTATEIIESTDTESTDVQG